MPGFLLDTCTALWYFGGINKIPASTLAIIRNPQNNIFFSDVSLLEIIIKQQIGKIDFPQPASALLPHWCKEHGVKQMPLQTKTILRLQALPIYHKDPFDRLLLSQSLVCNSPILSPDSLLHQYSEATIIWR